MFNTVFTWCVLSAAWVAVALNWGQLDLSFSKKLAYTWGREKAALTLATENRILQAKVTDLEFKVGQLETEKSTLTALAEGKRAERSIASVAKPKVEDLVNWDVYQWTPEKLLAIGEKELHFKNYAKSSQFLHELVTRFPKHALIDDRTLFSAGIAAFEAKEHAWAIQHFGKLVEKHPKSHFQRGAKLWLALAQYKSGNYRMFASTVEEFRLKYRNTEEWKILSQYYEEINYQFKQ